MSKIRNDTGLDAIRIEGGLLSSAQLNTLRHYQLPGQSQEAYGLEKGLRLSDELGRFWRIAQARWEQFVELRNRQDMNLDTASVETWLVPLLTRVLGFQLQTSSLVRVGERTFPVTHTGCAGVVPLVLTGPDHDLDKGSLLFGEEGHKRSPAGLLQEYLNVEDDCLWGLVSNGLTLRLLRDNPAMTRPAYLEIDLERIFTEELYTDFTVFWLLLHSSRFEHRDSRLDRCYLEQWREQGQTDGERVLGELRVGVTAALRLLGTGLISNPDNNALRAALQDQSLSKDQFFQELLRLIYRLLFLFTAEDRNIHLDPGAEPAARELYRQGYSLGKLRERARFRRYHDKHTDAWQQLRITFAGFATGQPRLAQPPLGGLFSADQCPNIDQSALSNRYLYEAIFRLGYFEYHRALVRINYRDMDTEELGSVYESLLELIPDLSVEGTWSFGFQGDNDEGGTTGHARKLTGSYYTPDSLVQELIQSALVPVLTERLKANPTDPREALLAISVCDPACGSGHFLLAAAQRLAVELARIEAGTDQPSEADYRHALREVVSHCIYGVDLNPLAVELCRTALWLETIEPGKPLGFLDAHIQVGNSLVGVLDPKLLEKGIPDEAFKPLGGDDKETAGELKRRNQLDSRQREMFSRHSMKLAACAGNIATMPEDSLEQVEQKRDTWLALIEGATCRSEKLRADLYTAAFFATKTSENALLVPTNMDLAALTRGESLAAQLRNQIEVLARNHLFFHWPLAFPEVFANGGFDVLLGNPPWDMLQFDPQEFFSSRDSGVAKALHTAARERLIAKLETENNGLYEEYRRAQDVVLRTQAFVHSSERFPYTSRGRINLAPLFAELSTQALSPAGRAGILVPSGIATDSFTQHFFRHISEGNKLLSLYDFENREALFPGVHRSSKFCLLTLGTSSGAAEMAFFVTQTSHLKDIRRCFRLTPEEFGLINPNTLTCPVFRSQKDAELTKKIYRTTSVLIKEASENKPEQNPWGVSFQLMFMMNTASYLFRTFREMQEKGAKQIEQQWQLGDQCYFPLYEGKMVHHYDHRWSTYETSGESSRDCSLTEKQNPDYYNLPRYWVDDWEVTLRTARAPKPVIDAANKENQEDLYEALSIWTAGMALANGDTEIARQLLRDPSTLFADNLSGKPRNAHYLAEQYPLELSEYTQLLQVLNDRLDHWTLTRQLLESRRPSYLLGWRDITNATNERTVIAGIIPLSAVGNNLPLCFVEQRYWGKPLAALLANLCSIVFDFVARHKVGGTHLNFFIFKQLPVLPPTTYTPADLDFIVPRVLELTYTAHDLAPFAEDLGYTGPPFAFEPARRAILRAELDAWFARLYGLTRDELQYILDPAETMGADYPSETFRVLKKNEIAEFSEYRTQHLVLEAWDRLAGAVTIAKVVPEADVNLYPETAADWVICAVALTLVRQSGGIGSMDHLDALILAARPELCRKFLNPTDHQALDAALASAPKALWADNNQDIRWKECRDYLEDRQAVSVRHGLKDQPITTGPNLSAVQETLPGQVDEIARIALNALARVRELRLTRVDATPEQERMLNILDNHHLVYQLVA